MRWRNFVKRVVSTRVAWMMRGIIKPGCFRPILVTPKPMQWFWEQVSFQNTFYILNKLAGMLCLGIGNTDVIRDVYDIKVWGMTATCIAHALPRLLYVTFLSFMHSPATSLWLTLLTVSLVSGFCFLSAQLLLNHLNRISRNEMIRLHNDIHGKIPIPLFLQYEENQSYRVWLFPQFFTETCS